MAWAFDGHLNIPQMQTDALFEQLADGDNSTHDQHSETGCDHCCHASAHLIGIVAGSAKGLSASRSNLCSANTTTLISFLAIPVSPPPKH